MLEDQCRGLLDKNNERGVVNQELRNDHESREDDFGVAKLARTDLEGRVAALGEDWICRSGCSNVVGI